MAQPTIWMNSKPFSELLKAGKAVIREDGMFLTETGEQVGVDDGLPVEGVFSEESEDTRMRRERREAREKLRHMATPVLVKEDGGCRYVEDIAEKRSLGIENVSPGSVVDLTR